MRDLIIDRSTVGDYFGQEDLSLESYGQLHTDIYGLSTATAVWVSPADAMKYPSMYSPHPIWGFLHMEKRTVSVEYGHVRTQGEYAGFEGNPVPVVEYTTAVNEEPIQTHPNFADFGGTPSNPLNGAQFVSVQPGHVGESTKSDQWGVFDKFWSNPPNKWSGVTSYLLPVIVQRTTSLAPFPQGFTGQVGTLFGGMLCTLVSITQRGIVYQTVVELRGPGPRGWNTDLYP